MDHSFSVLLSVYWNDNPDLFKRALDSIYSSNILPREVVVVEDGPIPDTIRQIIINRCAQDGFISLRLEKNSGLAAALNYGLKFITSTYTFRADADDFNLPNRFELQIEVLKKGYELVGGYILEVDHSNSPIAIRRVPLDQYAIRSYISRRNPFNHMTVAFKTKSVIAVGGYPDVHLKEDYALWAKMLATGCSMCNIDSILVHATAGKNMYKRRSGLKYVRSEYLIQKVLLRLGMQNVFSALFYGLIRSTIFIAPNFIRQIVYEKFLRANNIRD